MSCPAMARKNRYRNVLWALFLGLILGMSVEALAASDAWAIEDASARARLPDLQIIPAADAATPAENSGHKPDTHWYRSHGNHGSTRFSSLKEIHRNNVSGLKQAWVYHSGDGVGNIQCNPIAVDGILYMPTVGHCIVAVDGAHGKEQWRFKPEGQPAFRGLTYWNHAPDGQPRLLFNAGEWLYMLDPQNGKPITSFGKQGRARTGHFRVAPAVHNTLILLSGYEGDAFALDLETGQERWRFHTRPRAGEYGHETWSQVEAGANDWSGTALDSSRGIFYLTTGSPKPNFIGNSHRGDNLFSNCVIALDATSGKRLWHFQEISHDIWDLDLPAPPVLVSVHRGNELVDAVATVSKMGNTLLLDRTSGQPLFPFRRKKAPVSRLHGEETAPYQPALQRPQPFARPLFGMDQITRLSPEAHQAVLNQLHPSEAGASANMGWFEPFEAGKPTAFFGIHGGAEWSGAAFDPSTGFLYVTSNELPWFPTVSRVPLKFTETAAHSLPGRKIYEKHCMACHGHSGEGSGVHPPLIRIGQRMTRKDIQSLLSTGRNLMPAASGLDDAMTHSLLDYLLFEPSVQEKTPSPETTAPRYTYNGYPKLLDHEGYPGCQPPWGTLNCVDLNRGILRWQVPLGEHEILTQRGHSITGTENFGGATVTAGGLVFAAGTRDLKIRAFDAVTGEELWSHRLPFGGYAPPTTYEAMGKQYIVIPATGGGKLGGTQGDAYVAFALDTVVR